MSSSVRQIAARPPRPTRGLRRRPRTSRRAAGSTGPAVLPVGCAFPHPGSATVLPAAGARLANLVHRDRGWSPGPITRPGALRWWRTPFAFHGIPQWQSATLWRSKRRLEMGSDATRRLRSPCRDGCRRPSKGRSIAWRYELWATRARRVRDETAQWRRYCSRTPRARTQTRRRWLADRSRIRHVRSPP